MEKRGYIFCPPKYGLNNVFEGNRTDRRKSQKFEVVEWTMGSQYRSTKKKKKGKNNKGKDVENDNHRRPK